MKKNLLYSMLALLMTFLGTSNVSAGWIQKFVDQGVTADFNILFVDGSDVTIDKVTFAPIYHNDGTTDWYFNSNFLIQKDTKWLIRPGGLYQFNGGSRKFAAAVTKGQVITIEASGDPTPVSNCTVKSQSGTTYTYTATDDGYAVFNPARYLYFYKISVEDPSADEVNYTVKYMCGTTEVKPSTTGSGKPGDPITLSDTEKQNYYTSDGSAGYVYESDDSGSKTIAADGSTVVTVSFREAKVMTCKIKAMIDDAVADEMTCGDFEGKTTSVSYHQFILKDGRLYEAADENKEYNLHFVMDGTDQEIEYNPTSFTNVVYFSEAEDISGMRWSESANANIRCSNGAGAYNDGEAPVHAATLPAGIYRISAQVWGNTGETLKVELGENVLACETTGSRVAYIAEFTINEETDLMIPVCGSSSKMLDWIFVQKTGDVEPAKDLYIIGSGTPSEWSTTTPMTLNAETNAYEYELTLSGMSYFTIGDAAFTDWDDFNTHRYGIGGGDVVAPIGTPTQLEKYDNGTLVIETAGVYKVSVTKDLMMTITKTADVTATVDKVQIKGATDSEWSNQITVDLTEGEENVYTGVLDPAGSTNDVEFKLVVNDGSWIGYNELTLDAPDGWVVAQSGDKSNFVLKNADTGFKNYTVTATWVPNADFVANWTLKIEGKDKIATEPEVVDITVEPADGTDIYDVYAAKVKEVTDAGNIVGDIYIKLDTGGNYTISNSIVANQGITIDGAQATIDASGLTAPFIAFNAEPTFAPVESGQYVILNGVGIFNVTINGLTKALFSDNSKPYVYQQVVVGGSVINYATQSNVVFNFAASMAVNLSIYNSTFYSDAPGTANFIAMSGKRPWQVTGFEDQTGKFNCSFNTFYNIAKAKQFFNTNTLKGQKYLYEMNSNIFVNVSNKKIYGNMTNNKNQLTTDGKNTYLWEGSFFSEPNYNGDEGLGTDPAFKDAANGDFAIADKSEQALQSTGDPRWGTYAALAVKVGELANGTVKPDKQFGQEGDIITLTVTPAEGYELESLTVKDGADAEVTVNEDNTFTMPATDVTVTATFKKLPVDVNITVESGKDIAAEVEAAADGAPIKSITVTLAENGEYPISKTLSSPGNVTINGAEGAVIDASSLTAPLITLSGTTEQAKNADGSDNANYKAVEDVTIKDVTITGLTQSVVKDDQKTLVGSITIDNSVIEFSGSKNIFDFNSKGYPAAIKVNNSTLWSATSHTGYFLQASGRVKDLDSDQTAFKETIEITNSTLVNISVNKQLNNLQGKGQKSLAFTLTNSILVNTGSSTGNEVRGWLGGQNSTNPTITYENNTYWSAAAGGEAVAGWTDASKQGSDQSETALTTDPEFKDAANGDFTVGESTEQAELETGDPRWLTEFVGGEGDATDLLAEIEEAKKLLGYDFAYYDENTDDPGKALVDAIRSAEDVAESAASQKKIDKAIETLKEAELTYGNTVLENEIAESESLLALAEEDDELVKSLAEAVETAKGVLADDTSVPANKLAWANLLDKYQKDWLTAQLIGKVDEANSLLGTEEPKNETGKALKEAADAGQAELDNPVNTSESLADAYTDLVAALEAYKADPTGIRGIEANDTDDAPVYNMGGQRVSSHAKGIVIKNGKKIIRK